ncbi:SHOCT domain-containing protein [Pedococcus sp. KACC 23699]|uniref:SHOCT domain-containing protein n=1 Tax=Pedococcus sp. KACC 23699 TaxID=3149228 RepID=A0AAU7JYC2_9MICO
MTGRRPSATLATMLDGWLLPREVIMSGVVGNEGLDRLFVLLTPLQILILREGRACRVSSLAFAEWTGWQLYPAWSGPTFVLGTHHGLVELRSVDATHAQQFVYATEHHVASALAPSGLYAPAAWIGQALDALVTAVLTARGAGPAQEFEIGTLVAAQSRDMLAAAVRTAGSLTLEMAWSLFALGEMAGAPPALGGPGNTVRDLLATWAAPFVPAECELFTVGSPAGRADVARAAEEVVRVFSAGVPVQDRGAVSVFANLTQQLHDLATPVRQLAAPAVIDASGEGGVLAQLERLATLHATGALTDEEFVSLKHQLLATSG